jgi:hypothetical protein
VVARSGLDAAVEHTVKALLECGPRPCGPRRHRCGNGRTAADGIRQPQRRRIGQSFLTDEPQRLMQGFLDRKR